MQSVNVRLWNPRSNSQIIYTPIINNLLHPLCSSSTTTKTLLMTLFTNCWRIVQRRLIGVNCGNACSMQLHLNWIEVQSHNLNHSTTITIKLHTTCNHLSSAHIPVRRETIVIKAKAIIQEHSQHLSFFLLLLLLFFVHVIVLHVILWNNLFALFLFFHFHPMSHRAQSQ